MTGAPDEETTRKSDSDEGATQPAASPPDARTDEAAGEQKGKQKGEEASEQDSEQDSEEDSEEERSDLELIDATPSPVSLPLRASEAPPSTPDSPAPATPLTAHHAEPTSGPIDCGCAAFAFARRPGCYALRARAAQGLGAPAHNCQLVGEDGRPTSAAGNARHRQY